MKKRKRPANDNAITLCYLYVIGLRERNQVLNYVKIGVSENVDRRLRDMYTGTPFDVFCELKIPMESRVAAMSAESQLHRDLADLRVKGEWFELPPRQGGRYRLENYRRNLNQDG